MQLLFGTPYNDTETDKVEKVGSHRFVCTQKLIDSVYEDSIRILHECQVWIDKSVPRVTFCQIVTLGTDCIIAFNPLKSIHPVSRYHVCFVPFQVAKSPSVMCHWEIFSLSYCLHLQMNERKSVSRRQVPYQKLIRMPILSISTITFCTPG